MSVTAVPTPTASGPTGHAPKDLRAWNAALNEAHDMAGLRARGGRIVHHVEARRRALVADAVRRPAPQRVLDIGCEDGWIADAYAAHVPEVVLADIDARMLARADVARRANVRVLEADATAPAPLVRTLGRGWADMIVLSALLEHLPRPDAALHALRPLLAPRGRFVVYLPADGPIALAKAVLRHTRLGGLVKGLSLAPAPGHLHVFGRRQVHALLRPHGAIEHSAFDPVCLGHLATVRVGGAA